MRCMWTSYIVMLQQSALKKTLNFFMKVNPPFPNIFLRARARAQQYYNVIINVWSQMTRRVPYPFHRIILIYSPSPHTYIYRSYIIYTYHREWLTTHTIMSSKWFFFHELKIEYYYINNSCGTYSQACLGITFVYIGCTYT